MNNSFTGRWDLQETERRCWYLVWFSLPLSLKMTSICLIVTAAVTVGNQIISPCKGRERKWLAATPFFLFFLWQAAELLTSGKPIIAWKETEKQLSFAVIPLLFLITGIRRSEMVSIATGALVSSLLICSLLLLPAAFIRFHITGDPAEFSYHQLASPLHTGAIYFSLYLLYALFMAGDPAWLPDRPKMKAFVLLFLLTMLLLMAARMLLVAGIPLLIWYNRRTLFRRAGNLKIWLIAGGILLIAGTQPLITRIKPLLESNPGMAFAMDFRHAPEPNGLQLRLIFWRFGIETLNDRHAWITGTGMADAQILLNEKMVEYGLYTGTRTGSDTGYLNYNLHNQFMETLFRQGIIGLILLCILLMLPFIRPGKSLMFPPLFALVVVALFLTESVLERQAGIVFFVLISSGFLAGKDPFLENGVK